MLLIARVIPVIMLFGNSLAFNRNISYTELLKCKEYQMDLNSYEYLTTFDIADFKNNDPNDTEVFRLRFFVLADRDASILISNEEKVQNGDQAYEFVLGAFGNTKSVMRATKYGEHVQEKDGPILSALYPTEIVLILNTNGEFHVILPGYERPYLRRQNDTLRQSRFLSFAGWEGSSARWFYDCPLGAEGPGGNIGITDFFIRNSK